jgi:ABC-type multidrug transport system permease subunit
MLSLLISLVIAGLIVYVIFWGLGELRLPEPFNRIIKVIVVIAVVLYLINILMGFTGTGLLK